MRLKPYNPETIYMKMKIIYHCVIRKNNKNLKGERL